MVSKLELVTDAGPTPDSFELIARWRRWLNAQGLAAETIHLYSYSVFRLLTEQVDGPPTNATEDHVSAFLASLGHRATARTLYMRGMRSFFRYLHAREIIARDPTVGLKPRKPRHRPAVALTDDELIRYFIAAWARHPRRAWALMLCFGAGLRRMEAAAIRPEDIQGDVLEIRLAKYGKSRRVELSRYARVALDELRPWYNNGSVLGGIDRRTLTEWARQAAVDSGLLPKVRGRVHHVLRASFATHLLRNGAPVQVVRDLLGHESIMTTNSYAAVEPEERRRAVGLL
jgi:site-specific recombinase XerD